MKAKLKEPFRIDKKRTLIRGSIVEIVGTWEGHDGHYYICVMPDDDSLYVGGSEYAGTKQIIKAWELEIVDYTPFIDWEQARIQASIAAMQGFIADPHRDGETKDLAILSVRLAYALIEELKKMM